MSNKILITGGKGFIGTHLNNLLHGESYDIKEGKDIFDYNLLLNSLKDKETVIHLAALISANESIEKPGKYHATNTAGTDTVIRAAIKMGCKYFIFASSAAVYNPENPYGLSKLISEQLLDHYKNQIKTVSLRFFNVYGVGQNPEYAGVITKFMQSVSKGNDLEIYGDGTQTRDFISVTDIATIINKLLLRINQVNSGSVFEVGTGYSISIKDLASFFANKFGVDIHYQPTIPRGIRHSKSNNSHLLSVIGNHEFISLYNGLNKLILSSQSRTAFANYT